MSEPNRTKEVISVLKKQSEKELMDAKYNLGVIIGLKDTAITGSEKDAAQLAEMFFKEQISRRERDMVFLDATFTMLNDMVEEIISLKITIKNLGGKIDNTESLLQKRENMFRKIEELFDGLTKGVNKKKDKWCDYDTY